MWVSSYGDYGQVLGHGLLYLIEELRQDVGQCTLIQDFNDRMVAFLFLYPAWQRLRGRSSGANFNQRLLDQLVRDMDETTWRSAQEQKRYT